MQPSAAGSRSSGSKSFRRNAARRNTSRNLCRRRSRAGRSRSAKPVSARSEMAAVAPQAQPLHRSFPRKRESRSRSLWLWVPAFAGTNGEEFARDVLRNCCPGAVSNDSPAVPNYYEHRVVVAAPLELIEAGGRGERRARRLLHHGERTLDEPPAGAGRGERSLREALTIGRIEEGERKRRQRMDAAELDRIAAENTRDAAQAERLDVFPHERARLGGIVDEQREDRTARERFEPKRAASGKEIEHAGTAHGIGVSVHEDIEQRLAQPVGGRPDRLRLGCGKRAAAQAPADDAHQRASPRARLRCPRDLPRRGLLGGSLPEASAGRSAIGAAKSAPATAARRSPS